MKLTPEQTAAFAIAQASLLNAEVKAMEAENQHRLSCGHSIAYGAKEFEDVIRPFRNCLREDILYRFMLEGERP